MLSYKVFLPDGMNITQGRNGSLSHQGANAYDEASKDTGISKFHAPCDMHCIGFFGSSAGANYTFYETDDKVTLRSGEKRRIQIMMLHGTKSNSVGKKYKKGDVIYNEGTQGYASGNHAHIEYGYGFSSSPYYLRQNSKGVWVANFSEHINVEDIFYVPKNYSVYEDRNYNFASMDTTDMTKYYWSLVENFEKSNRYYHEAYRLKRTDFSTCNLFADFAVGEKLRNKYDSRPFAKGEYVNSNAVGWSAVYTNDNGDKFRYYVHELRNQYGNVVYFAYKKEYML